MDSGNKRFSDLVTGKSYFEIPDFQRNYSWEAEHLEDLWRDLVYSNFNKKHYFGTFLLKEEKNNRYKVIDGQQRLTSILILLKAMNDFLLDYELEESKKLANKILNWYIKDLEDNYKLKLMGDDHEFFKNYILGNSSEKIYEVSTPSQDRLMKAYIFFEDILNEKTNDYTDEESIKFIEKLLNKIESLDLMVYLVKSEADSVLIFEVVNDRGKGLTDLEKTKSFLMHQLYLSIDEKEIYLKNKLDSIKEKFGEIYKYYDVIDDKININEDRIQRYHYIIWDLEWSASRDERYYQNHLINLKNKFREMNNEECIDKIEEYAEELRQYFFAFKEVVSYKNLDKDLCVRLERIFALGRLGNLYPLIISTWLKFKDGDINKESLINFLDLLETYIFRVYGIKQRPANTGRNFLYKSARTIFYNGDFNNIKESIMKRTKKYCNNRDLANSLNEDVYPGRFSGGRAKELRYLLYYYEKKLEDALEGYNFNLNDVVSNKDNKFTIEHIWPQNDENLNITDESLYNEFKYKLGNLAMVTDSFNSKLSNKSPDKKEDLYKKSKFRMLKEIVNEYNLEDWDDTQIANRSNKIINFAKKRWSIN